MPTKKTTAQAEEPKTKKTESPKQESFKVNGEDLIAKVKNLIKEGNIRRITIKDKNGKSLIVLPLSIGVAGLVLAPVWAALGALAALVTECTITIERRE